MTSSRYNSALHTVALLTACATFPLIFMGGLVTSHGAGMSVPDWPNSYGYNMFLFPPRLWIGGILYEHTHRLMGTVVGMLAIVLVIVAWKTEPRKWVRHLAAATLAAVIVQGILGGLRVVLVKLDLAIVHACFAQAFFCLTALMAIVTSKWWRNADRVSEGASLTRIAVITTFVIYLQLIAGAVMRHYQAGLAIPDFPLSYGKMLPPTSDAEIDARVVATAHSAAAGVFPLHIFLSRPTLAQVWLHFAHRLGAIVVSATVVTLATKIFRASQSHGALVRPAILLVFLLLVQVSLGIATVLMRKPADIASAHVAVGALTLVTTFVIAVRSVRLHRSAPRSGFDVLPAARMEVNHSFNPVVA